MSFTDEQIARIVHGAAVELAIVLGDPALPAWAGVPESEREIVTSSVRIARHGAPPRALHDNWVREKQAAGWTYGEVKDAEAKTHPLMVDFDSLPPEEQAKAYLLSGVCVAMNAASNVKTRAENELLALQEAEQLARAGGGNMALRPGAAPFGGLPPVVVDLAAAAPQPPAQPREE